MDYLEGSDSDSLEAPPAQLVILAVDETPDAEHLEHLKAALTEVLPCSNSCHPAMHAHP